MAHSSEENGGVRISDDSVPSLRGPGLIWGIKRSLLDYVGGLADGDLAVNEDVSVTADLRFCFPMDDMTQFDEATRTGAIRFRGAIQLTGHHGLLAFVFANPWLHLDASGGELSIDGGQHEPRTILLSFPCPPPTDLGGALRWDVANPTLTQAGAERLDFYTPDVEFDPLSATVPRR